MKVAQIRKTSRLSQTETVSTNRRHFEPSQISNFEQGQREPPDLLLRAYARLVELSTDVLTYDKLDLPLVSSRGSEGT